MFQLKFEIHSYWQAASGRGGGTLVDSIVQKKNGLPFLPGRTIKGLLRDAVFRAEHWKQIPVGTTLCLFGSTAPEEGINRLETEAGALAVSDAVLPAELTGWLLHPDTDNSMELCQAFFKQIATTKINPETGCAEDQSLRSIEVTIPLQLTAQLTIVNENRLNEMNWGKGQNWINAFKPCLKLIRAIGTSRSRGLGRVTVTMK